MNRKKETLIFLVKLLLLSIPLYLIIFFRIELGFLQNFIVGHLVPFLNFVGIEARREGFNVVLQKFTVVINKDCTGWKGLLFFGALVLSTKLDWKKRLFGFFIGLPAVFSINILRIFLMILIGDISKEMFSFFHDVLWQGSMILVVLLVWYMWWRLGNIYSFGDKK